MEIIIKDKNGKIWFIDFSVSNIYPRILEIVIINTHLVMDYSNFEKTEFNKKLIVQEYEKFFDLTPFEKDNIKNLELIAYSIEYLNSVYELRKEKNDSAENKFYIKSSIRGLLQSGTLNNEETEFLNTFKDTIN